MFEELIPDIQEPARELVRAAGAAGLHPRVTSTIRGRTEQARLYRRFQAGLAKYPVAPPGTSAHEFGYAFDMVCTPLDALADVGYTCIPRMKYTSSTQVSAHRSHKTTTLSCQPHNPSPNSRGSFSC
jgi:hypothetical protein